MDWTAEVKKINEKYKIEPKSTTTYSQGSHAQTSQYQYQQSVGSNSTNMPTTANQSLSVPLLAEGSAPEVEEKKE